jgi:hypothetical protein
MQVATLVIAVVAVVLSASSLCWQAATFVLTGGRVTVELVVGALDATGSNLVTAPISGMTQTFGDTLRAQGFTRPVVGVQVHNVGRGLATITEWSLVMQDGTALTPTGASIGPPLAHRMEGGGEPARWVVDTRWWSARGTPQRRSARCRWSKCPCGAGLGSATAGPKRPKRRSERGGREGVEPPQLRRRFYSSLRCC